MQKQITFRQKIVEKDDDSYIITVIDEKLPYELFRQCLKKGLVTLIEDYDFDFPQKFWNWNEEKATKFFESLGYTVISSKEAEEREKIEKELKIKASKPETFISHLKFEEEYIGLGFKNFLKIEKILSEEEKEIELKDEKYNIIIKKKAKIKTVIAERVTQFYDDDREEREKARFVIVEIDKKRYFAKL